MPRTTARCVRAAAKPTPKGDGWDAEHQLGTVSARQSKKGK